MNVKIKELWRDIVNYEGLYQVSSLGRVKSLKFGKERILRLIDGGKGYLIVNLHKDGKAKNHYVHRLIAEAFIPNPDNLPEINHIDEDKTNNCVKNLEWCDRIYNNNYGTRNIKVSKSRSKPVLQLTLDGQLVREWPSTIEAEQQGGFQHSLISSCCSGKRNTHSGYVWKYKKAI